MRNHYLLSILIMHCCLILNASRPQNRFEVSSFIEINGKAIVTLHLSGWKSDSVKVSLFQDGQAAIFEETHLTVRNAKNIDFAILPIGIYVFEVEDKLKIVQQKVYKTLEEVVVLPQLSHLYKPTFKQTKTHWFLSDFIQGAGCTISINDAQNNTINLDLISEGQAYIQKAYNHSLLQPGLYTINIVLHNRVFSREFFIEPKSTEPVVNL